MIIDANNLILGRLSSFVAKKALLGEKIEIVNCENCIITGDKPVIFAKYDRFVKMGTHEKGPFIHRMPHKLVKRTIRGMMPYKTEKGRAAFKSIKCHIGVPENLKNEKFESIKNASAEKVPNLRYIKIIEVCRYIGAKI